MLVIIYEVMELILLLLGECIKVKSSFSIRIRCKFGQKGFRVFMFFSFGVVSVSLTFIS